VPHVFQDSTVHGSKIGREKCPTASGISLVAFALVNSAEVDLLESETLKELHGRLIPLDGLDFHEAEILFLQITKDIHHEEFGQPLTANVFAGEEV
jgi:hypothetical protein